MDLLVSNGLVVRPEGVARADIAVANGTIVEISPEIDPGSARDVVDANGRYVLPGIVDAHNHPVYGDKIGSMSRSAVAGGITTLLSFYQPVPDAGEPVDQMRARIAEGEESSLVDFGIHLSFNEMVDAGRDLRLLLDLGIPSLKLFMTHPRRATMVTDDRIVEVMSACAEMGLLCMIHAENAAMVDHLRERSERAGRTGARDWARSRPNVSEAEAVFRAASLAEVAGVPLYVVHLSAAESIEAIRWHRGRSPKPIYAETMTHYLALTEDDLERMGGLAKISPPLRQERDRLALWDAVGSGVIDVIATDGSGQNRADKAKGGANFFEVGFGIPGVQHLLPVTYDEGVARGRIGVDRLAEVLSGRPARIFGLERKGRLAVGMDADLVVLDQTRAFTITATDERGNSDYSVYEGRRCAASVAVTIGRGEVLFADGLIRASPGRGRFLARGRHAPVPVRT